MLGILPWSAPFWVAVGIVLSVCGLGLSIVFWWRPREAKKRLARHERLWVESTSLFPVFDHPDGSRTIGEHQVGVVVHNGTSTTVQVTGWGIGLPDERTLSPAYRRQDWQERLPYALPGGQEVSFWLDAGEVRRHSDVLGVPFDQMVPFVNFGDGRKVTADRPVPME